MNVIIEIVVAGLFIGEAGVQITEINERRQIYNQARVYADSIEKPLLVVGAPKFGFNHPCGDVTIDNWEHVPTYCSYELADVRNIPYPDGYFGAAYISHVVEHLPTIEDAFKALDELERVADRVFVVSPHKYSIAAWLHPNHSLWVTSMDDSYLIEQRKTREAREELYYVAIGEEA